MSREELTRFQRKTVRFLQERVGEDWFIAPGPETFLIRRAAYTCGLLFEKGVLERRRNPDERIGVYSDAYWQYRLSPEYRQVRAKK